MLVVQTCRVNRAIRYPLEPVLLWQVDWSLTSGVLRVGN